VVVEGGGMMTNLPPFQPQCRGNRLPRGLLGGSLGASIDLEEELDESGWESGKEEPP